MTFSSSFVSPEKPTWLGEPCKECKRPVLLPTVPGRVAVAVNEVTQSKTAYAHDGVHYDVCSCKPAQKSDATDTLADSLLRLGADIRRSVEGAKLRHELKGLPDNLKPVGDLVSFILDPAGTAADMMRRYLEKNPDPLRAQQEELTRRSQTPAPRRARRASAKKYRATKPTTKKKGPRR